MSTFPIGTRSPLLYPNVTNPSDLKPGEVVATTPLGRDENGKNLVAYIVRTDEEVPAYKLPNNLANGNTPKKSFLSDTATQQELLAQAQIKTKQDKTADNRAPQRQTIKNENTSAQFIKPDDLLSRLEQSQVDQLRARDDAVRADTTPLNDGAGHELLTSLIFNTGPDGRRYAVGVSAPLVTQQQSQPDHAATDEEPSSPTGKAVEAYKKSAYFNATDFRSGLLNKAI
ncbi:MAG: hypothetical protein K2Q32_05645 [Alphaproteobacteria bacterium]|nr:hypothetical protein [Alphaproteobacteria bacterium]